VGIGYHYRRSALPTFADYAVGMRKPIRRDGDRKSKSVADARNEIALTPESALPPKKPLAPSVKRRLRRGEGAEAEMIAPIERANAPVAASLFLLEFGRPHR
jgi:hypothetical protein